ncbi:TPA: peptidoglycan-binding domain-containing protein [Aeromonas veronii]
MAAEEENNKKNEGKGFAGLSSLVSDVDTSLPPPAKQEAETAGASSNAERRSAPESQQQEAQPKQQQPYQAPSPPSSGSSTGKWVLGIAAVIGVLWLIGEADKSPSSPAPSYTPPAGNTAPTYSAAPAQPQVPSRPEETRPPVGQDLVFSTAQIRYCLAEDIRMDAAKAVLNNYSDSDVDRFNAMVADYNSRCGSFRYRSGALESARRDVEPYRSQLQAEGRSRFARSPSTGSLSAPAPARPAADETVRAVQQKLNELGYNAGPADGLLGRGTRAAIIAFQQDRGVAATGVADQALLLQLQRAPSRSTATITPPSRSSSPPAMTDAPSTQSSRTSPSGKPDLSAANPSERVSIENACNYDRQYRSSADYYNCLRRELTKLSAHSGKPDLSRASQSEQAAIENACNYDRQYRGPGDYYSCLRRELGKLGSTAGKPSLAQATPWEQTAIENACNYDRQYRGPGDYYSCLRRELQKLDSSRGRPDLSRLSQFEQTSIENACNYDRQYRGPGDYYGCLRREANKLR